MTLQQIIFLCTAAALIFAAVRVVTAQNLVHSALWLIAALFGVAVIYALLEAGFFAVVQVSLYIGAIAILILFTIMLTRRVMQDTGPQTNRGWWLAGLAAAAMFGGIVWSLAQVPWALASTGVPEGYLAVLGSSLVDPDQYLIIFEVAGMLLLLAMIGAIVVAVGTTDKKGV